MKYFSICVLFLLCIGSSYAQEMKRTDKDYEKIFHTRLSERMERIGDYVHFLSRCKDQTAQVFYSQKLQDLFEEKALAVIRRKVCKEKTDTLTINQLIAVLKANMNTVLSIDSIEVPIWSGVQVHDDSISVCRVDSKMVLFPCNNKVFSQDETGRLPIVKENTEKGYEWVPLFGNIVLTCDSLVNSEQAYDTTQAILNKKERSLYNNRVKFIDEFMDRFNGRAFRSDLAATDSNLVQKNLLLLFDSKQFSSFQDRKFQEAKHFVSTVLNDSTQLHFSDTTWLAKAVCRATLHGKPVDFVMYLNIEHRKKDMYKWVIAKVEGACFSLLPPKIGISMLLPDAHETNFMSLHNVTANQAEYIRDFTQRNYKVDETSVFLTYVKSGLLKIDYVSSLEFIFLQVPGYCFEVKYCERNTANSGWLIAAIHAMPDSDKKSFLDYIYNATHEE